MFLYLFTYFVKAISCNMTWLSDSGFVNEFDIIIFLEALFDVVPGIKFQDAIQLIRMQPVS